MDFFCIISTLKNAYSAYKLSQSFVDKFEFTINQIGETELESSLVTIKDSVLSTTPKREIDSAITQLRLSFGKLNGANYHKTQVATLLSILYYCVGEIELGKQYKEISIETFSHFIDIQELCITSFPSTKKELSEIIDGSFKYDSFDIFDDLETVWGIKWKGPKPASLAKMGFMKLFSKTSYRKQFHHGAIIAKKEFELRINSICQ